MARDVRIKIGAEDSASRVFQRVSTNASSSFGNIKMGAARAAKSIGVIGAAVAAVGVGVVAAGKKLKQFTDEFGEFGDKIHKTSLRTKLDAEFLSELAFAAEQSGTSFEQASDAIFRAFRRIGNAQTGTGPAARALMEIGLNAKELSREQPEQVFFKLADALNAVDDEMRRSQMGFEIFGDSWKHITPLIESGSDEMRNLMKEAKALGATLTDEQSKIAAEYTDELNRLETALRGVRLEIGAALAPGATGVAERVRGVVQNRQMIFDMERMRQARNAGFAFDILGSIAPEGLIRDFFRDHRDQTNRNQASIMGGYLQEAFTAAMKDVVPPGRNPRRQAPIGVGTSGGMSGMFFGESGTDRPGLGAGLGPGGGPMIFNMFNEPIGRELRANQSRLMQFGPAVDPALRQGEKVLNELQQLKDILGGGNGRGIPVEEQDKNPNQFEMVKVN